jgi:hypothetical protein
MGEAKPRRVLLLVAAALVVVGWQLPYGPQILYPLSLLATWAHELGHGLTALILGADFDRLLLFADGSGLAEWRGNLGRLGRAAVAAGGLIGPSIAGALVLIAARSPRRARLLLFVLALLIALSAVLWTRNLFGLVFLTAMAGALALSARLLPLTGAAFVAQLVGSALALSVFRDLDYMFSPGGFVGGELHRSDSAAIAEALFLPYWFWGGLVAFASLTVLAAGIAIAGRGVSDRA